MMKYVLKAKKIVTVTEQGTVIDGAIFVEDGVISRISTWREAESIANQYEVIDLGDQVVTPSLIDCHTHLFEFAPPANFPITEATHGLGAKALTLQALASGVTGLGEQICGFHKYDLPPALFYDWAKDAPLDIVFSASSVSIGFAEPAHFTAATGSKNVTKESLANPEIVSFLAENSEYPGENLFITSTPANFTANVVPTAGEIMYTQDQLEEIVRTFHQKGKKIGAHVAGEVAIRMALEAGIDVLHHAHGITEPLIQQAVHQKTAIVATPIGGTHLLPNSPHEIADLVIKNVTVAISTDAFLPPHEGADWIPAAYTGTMMGPETLMTIAQPAMMLLQQAGKNENEILALLTLNPAKIMDKDHQYGSLRPGLDANFIVSSGVPGLEVTDPEQIKLVYFKGEKVIERV